MKEHCRTHFYKGKLVKKELCHVLAGDNDKIIYCFIPKVGSKKRKTVLTNLHGTKGKTYTERIPVPSFWTGLKYNTKEETSEWIQTYSKFLFVLLTKRNL